MEAQLCSSHFAINLFEVLLILEEVGWFSAKPFLWFCIVFGSGDLTHMTLSSLLQQSYYQFSVFFNRVGVDLDANLKEEPSSHQASQRSPCAHRVQRCEMFCSVQLFRAFPCVAKRPALKGAAFADKTNQMTIKSTKIQGANNHCITFGVLSTSVHLLPLCSSRKPGNCSVGGKMQLLESGGLQLTPLPGNLLAR